MLYTITQLEKRWLLQVWEPAKATESRLLPILFKVRHTFDVMSEAIAHQREHYWEARPHVEMPGTPTDSMSAA